MQKPGQGSIIWLTGLPSAGKSTIAKALGDRLRQERPVEVLDADNIRFRLWPELMFDREDRNASVERLGYLARLLSKHGVTVIVAAISPYRVAREVVRGLSQNFIEIYVRCPVDLCITRDVKGLYKRALAGEIKGFTGVDDPYEPPDNPEVIVDTDVLTLEECVDRIVARLS